MNEKYDVIVIGGGPAGASAAICCASEGKDVLLIEKGSRNRYKSCGGILPLVAPETVEDIVGESIPDHVRATPRELGLYYIPPSGRKNSGRVKNYTIHNIDRSSFDQWLRDLASAAGVTVKHQAKCVDLIQSDECMVVVDSEKEKSIFKSDFVIGADGVRSFVRGKLFEGLNFPMMVVEQEYWKQSGDFEDCFYGFFREDVSISYAYLIPKGDSLILGLGAEPHQEPNVAQLLNRFRSWLEDEFSFESTRRIKKEAWSIPFGYFNPGKENVLLVGDAAGLCNPLSGEGIRLAIESGEAAAAAITSLKGIQSPVHAYKKDVQGLAKMISELNDFVRRANNEEREKFVEEELNRRT